MNPHVTLQFTRQGTQWPDKETCSIDGDTLVVLHSQNEHANEYKILSRTNEGRIKEIREIPAKESDTPPEEFYLAYNQGLDRYYVRSKNPDKPFITPHHTVGHRAFFHEPSKTVIWYLPRNGSSTVLTSLIYDTGEIHVNRHQPAMVWYNEQCSKHYFDVPDGKLPNPEKWLDYKHCLIYQDPAHRCVRHMNYVLSCNRQLLSTFFSEDMAHMENTALFVDTYLALAEINKYNTVSWYEPNLMPQMFYHKTLPVTPDIIIELSQLQTFIYNVMGITPVAANLETSIGITLRDISVANWKRIENIYGEDRLIETRFKDRWWTP